MKNLLSLLIILCISNFLSLYAGNISNDINSDPDSTVLILFERDTLKIPKKDTVPIPYLKNNMKLEFYGKIFTDFVGISDDQPNGLIQTNVFFSFIPNDSKRQGFFFFRNIVLADLTFSRIEDNEGKLPVRYNSSDLTQGYFNRIDLYQYAQFRTITKFNMVTYLNKAFTLYSDFTGSMYSTEIADSLKLSNSKNVTSLAIGFNNKLATEIDRRTGLSAELSFHHFWPKLFSDCYNESVTRQYFTHSGDISGYIQEKDISKYRKYTGISVLDFTLKHEGTASTQFLRIVTAGNFFSYHKNKPKNIYYQVQLGLAVDLEDFFKNASSDKTKSDKVQSGSLKVGKKKQRKARGFRRSKAK